MKDQNRFQFLLESYFSEKLSIEEYDELFDKIASGEYDQFIKDQIGNEFNTLDLSEEAGLPPHIAQEIIRNIKISDKNTAEILPSVPIHKNRWLRWVAAASVVLVLTTGYFLYNKINDSLLVSNFPGTIPKEQMLKKVSTDKTMDVVLADGSKVELQPNSTIYYSKEFAAKKREVILEGEAFFKVTKDPSKPFLVYYHHIVTKVLGTSFNIRTLDKTGNLEVAVKTGKVQVFENEKFVHVGKIAKAVIITPNQKVIYNTANENFEKTIVENPAPIALVETTEEKNGTSKKGNFVYNRYKLMDIFKEMSVQYGIEIIPENENFNNCLFTGDLNSQDLITKLKIICLTVNANYETIGTQIIIKGKGCAPVKGTNK